MAARFLGCVWLIAVLFRFIWVCLPQTGYIHPDEFFQATEITAGDIFGFKHLRTWEFNETFPVRSVTFPYVFAGFPLYILKKALGEGAITSRTLTVTPRLFISAASLIIDLSVYKISRHLRIDPAQSLCVLGTSFVTLVFYTRTFSNTAEVILFALLLQLVVSAISNGNTLRTRKDRLRYFSTGAVIAAGIWIRPTFVAFASVPMACLLLDICALKWRSDKRSIKFITHIFRYCICLGLGSILTMLVLIIADSHYFGYLQKKQFVATPVNFISYNLDTSSLKEHGLHPRMTHFLINMPLLYGPLALALYTFIVHAAIKRKFIDCASYLLRKRPKEDKNSDDYQAYLIWNMLLCSCLVPVLLLSFIPHQEPRFISPVLVPLVILFSRSLFRPFFTPLRLLSWCLWNILGCAMFGILHQGGLYPCLAHLQQYLYNAKSQTLNATYHVTFYHTYMPPQHLLAWPMHGHDNEGGVHHNLALYDLKGSSEDALKKHLVMITRLSNGELETHGTKSEVRNYHRFFKAFMQTECAYDINSEKKAALLMELKPTTPHDLASRCGDSLITMVSKGEMLVSASCSHTVK